MPELLFLYNFAFSISIILDLKQSTTADKNVIRLLLCKCMPCAASVLVLQCKDGNILGHQSTLVHILPQHKSGFFLAFSPSI